MPTNLDHYIDFTHFDDRPHIRDSHVLISDIVARGNTIAELAQEFDLTEAQVSAALLYHAENASQTIGKCLVKIDDIGTFIKYVDGMNKHSGGGGTQDGGLMIIDAVVEYMRDTYNMLIGRFTAHHFLHNVHTRMRDKDYVMSITGRDISTGNPVKHDLTSIEIRDMPRIHQIMTHLTHHICRQIEADRSVTGHTFDQVIVIGRPEYVLFDHLKSHLEETLQVEVIIKTLDFFDF